MTWWLSHSLVTSHCMVAFAMLPCAECSPCLLTDAKTNERMIESLKAAMDEQEATMETQDKVLQSREEHIQQMQTGQHSWRWLWLSWGIGISVVLQETYSFWNMDIAICAEGADVPHHAIGKRVEILPGLPHQYLYFSIYPSALMSVGKCCFPEICYVSV